MKKNILIVANDAGGAENLAAYIFYNSKHNYILSIDGPAIKIFKRYGYMNSTKLDRAFKLNIDLLITGTSWSTDLEKKAILQAKKNKIPSITILDNWVFYKERFVLGDKLTLPDEIWVCDEHAREIVKKEIGSVSTKVIKNPYFKIQKELYAKLKTPSEKPYALYISENINDHSKTRFGYTDQDAFDSFLINKQKCEARLSFSNIKDIIIRQHPSEKKDLYKKYLGKFKKFNIQLSENDNLLEDIKGSKYVVGLSSMAMAISTELGKPTISCIPLNGLRPHFLPYNSILDIVDL